MTAMIDDLRAVAERWMREECVTPSQASDVLRSLSRTLEASWLSGETGLRPDSDAVTSFIRLVHLNTAMGPCELLIGAGDYRPTTDVRELADLYDVLQYLRGDPRRAYRIRDAVLTVGQRWADRLPGGVPNVIEPGVTA